MTSPLQFIDDLIAPIITTANKVRQVRDALPPQLWNLVPSQLRLPLEALFTAVEKYDRRVGQLKDAGLME